MLLVCTNGRRDVCCALWGQRFYAAAAALLPNVWQTTHLGGHRFAATAVSLPAAEYFLLRADGPAPNALLSVRETGEQAWTVAFGTPRGVRRVHVASQPLSQLVLLSSADLEAQPVRVFALVGIDDGARSPDPGTNGLPG
jgi:hypothetical protein